MRIGLFRYNRLNEADSANIQLGKRLQLSMKAPVPIEQRGSKVKLITAVIQPHRLEEVKKAVVAQGIKGMTVSQVNGYGRQRGHTEVYRGAEYTVDLLPKVKIEILCDAAEASSLAEAIADAARSGRIGDGKIWISTVDEVIRVRTGDRGAEAL